MEEPVNARIESTMLGIEHGTLTYMLHLDFGGTAQGAGGVSLDWEGSSRYLMRLLAVVGVRQWEQLKGKNIRVRRDGPRGTIVQIGHLFMDEWLDIVPQNKEKS